jgi:hypothetical protein
MLYDAEHVLSRMTVGFFILNHPYLPFPPFTPVYVPTWTSFDVEILSIATFQPTIAFVVMFRFLVSACCVHFREHQSEKPLSEPHPNPKTCPRE